MARSSCPKCDSHTFEIVEGNPNNTAFRLMYVQCSSCGSVVGVMDYYNIGAKLEKLEKQEKELSGEIQRLKSNDETINNNLINLIRTLNNR